MNDRAGGSLGEVGRWCILRTAGPRTLPLARSLDAAGIAAWTPTIVTTHKRPRSSLKVERDAPILPTFVFVPETYLPQVQAALAMTISPHPAFSLFRYCGEIYRLRPHKMEALRAYEASEAAKYQRAKDRAASKPTKRHGMMPAIGALVRVQGEPGDVLFAGMTGMVTAQKSRHATVRFGSLPIDIETWLLAVDEVKPVPA